MSHETDIIEEWRDIPGYEGHYQVSTLGRVKSFKRNKIVTPVRTPNGFCVTLNKAHTPYKRVTLHRVVLKIFDPIEELSRYVVKFRNDDIYDPRLVNLYWQMRSGENAPAARLKNDDVRAIRRMWYEEPDISQAEIGRRFGIKPATVSTIISGRIWETIK